MKREIILSWQYEGIPLLLYSGKKEQHSRIFKEAYQAKAEALRQESMRLLYVALTRACDELHVFGAISARQKDAPEGSWYALIRQGMASLQAKALPTGMLPEGYYYTGEGICYCDGESLPEGNMAGQVGNHDEQTAILPAWLLNPRISLSRQPDVFLAASSLVAQESIFYEEEDRIQLFHHRLTPQEKGTLIHCCLQWQCGTSYRLFLAQLPRIIQQLAPYISDEDNAAITAELAALADQDELVSLLEAPAQAERAVIGYLRDGTGISGQIDRLIYHEDRLEILDIKTGAAPSDSAAIPAAYRAQLGAYRELLQVIMPDTSIDISLLYTGFPARYLLLD